MQSMGAGLGESGRLDGAFVPASVVASHRLPGRRTAMLHMLHTRNGCGEVWSMGADTGTGRIERCSILESKQQC
jgi:hypothetical protein